MRNKFYSPSRSPFCQHLFYFVARCLVQAENCRRIFRQPSVVLVVGRVAALSHLRMFGTSRGVFQPVLFGKIDLTSYKSNTVGKMNHTCFGGGGRSCISRPTASSVPRARLEIQLSYSYMVQWPLTEHSNGQFPGENHRASSRRRDKQRSLSSWELRRSGGAYFTRDLFCALRKSSELQLPRRAGIR